MSEPLLMTYKALKEKYGFPTGTIRRLVFEGNIPHIRLGPRSVRFETEKIDAWLASHRVDAKESSK